MNRIMRLILMYDFNMQDEKAIKEYNKFHRHIQQLGFIMMQYSVYYRVVNTNSKADSFIKAVSKHLPSKGNVRILQVTDREFMDIKILRGNKKINESINSNDRFIKINYDKD